MDILPAVTRNAAVEQEWRTRIAVLKRIEHFLQSTGWDNIQQFVELYVRVAESPLPSESLAEDVTGRPTP